MEIKDWIPLFIETVWPLFILIFLLLFWKNISKLIETIWKRVESKDSDIEVGSWLKIKGLRNEDSAVIKELYNIKDKIDSEFKKEKPDLMALEHMTKFQQTLEKQKIELESELREMSSDKSLHRTTKLLKPIDVAIVIGHKKTSPGAYNSNKSISEFDYNEELSIMIEKYLDKLNIVSERVYRRTYQELPDDINKINPFVVINLHANAFNGKTSGSEVLYKAGSERGKKLADLILGKIEKVLGLPNKGIKGKVESDRGGYLLVHTKPTTVVIEPFFIDNDADLSIAIDKKTELADSIATGLKEYIDMVKA